MGHHAVAILAQVCFCFCSLPSTSTMVSSEMSVAQAEEALTQLRRDIAEAQARVDILNARLPAARALVRRQLHRQSVRGRSSSSSSSSSSARSRSPVSADTSTHATTNALTDEIRAIENAPSNAPAPPPPPPQHWPIRRPADRCPRCWYVELGRVGGKSHAWGTAGCDPAAAQLRRRQRQQELS